MENRDHVHCLMFDRDAQFSLPFVFFCSSRDTGWEPVCIRFPNSKLHSGSCGLWNPSQMATTHNAFCSTWAPSTEQRPQLEVEHLHHRQPVSASKWIHLSLALFLFWFCDFSALYRNGIFWHLNKGELSSKFSLFVSRLSYCFSPLSPTPHQGYSFLSSKLFSDPKRSWIQRSQVPNAIISQSEVTWLRFKSLELMKLRLQGQWSDGLADLTLFQGHRLHPRSDQRLPSRAAEHGVELASALQTPSCPPSVVESVTKNTSLLMAVP